MYASSPSLWLLLVFVTSLTPSSFAPGEAGVEGRGLLHIDLLADRQGKDHPVLVAQVGDVVISALGVHPKIRFEEPVGLLHVRDRQVDVVEVHWLSPCRRCPLAACLSA